MPSFVPPLSTLLPFLIAALTRRLSALVFVYLAVQFAVGQRTRS
jgi:hypothetical protein